MSSKYFATLTAIVFSLMLYLPLQSNSQVIDATGNSQEAASQLIYYYNLALGDAQEPDENHIQVTNVNDTDGTYVHVQIFRSYDVDGTDPTPPVICDERDFVDFLTPNDTHVYELDDSEFARNEGETGESVNIDLEEPVPSEGFIVITPVVSEADLSAKSFHYLIGSSNHIRDAVTAEFPGSDDGTSEYSLNAMGRSAVDFTSGERVEDGTPLDGETNGFVVLQPAELSFNFAADGQMDIVGITFTDQYGEPGLLGYQVAPGSSTWNPFIFDWKESVTSCGTTPVSCFTTVGLHDDVGHLSTSNFGNPLLCGGASTPIEPGSANPDDIGWTRIFVSGLGDFVNQLGVYVSNEPAFDAKWMNSNR